MNYSLLRSRTFWTIVLMFVIGGGNALVPILPPAFQTLALAILGSLAAYFHLDTAKTFGAAN